MCLKQMFKKRIKNLKVIKRIHTIKHLLNSTCTHKVSVVLVGGELLVCDGACAVAAAARAQSALLGGRTRTREQVRVRCVADARRVRRVRRVPAAEVGVVHWHDNRAVLLRHGRHSVRVVRVRQMLLRKGTHLNTLCHTRFMLEYRGGILGLSPKEFNWVSNNPKIEMCLKYFF